MSLHNLKAVHIGSHITVLCSCQSVLQSYEIDVQHLLYNRSTKLVCQLVQQQRRSTQLWVICIMRLCIEACVGRNVQFQLVFLQKVTKGVFKGYVV